MQPVEKTESACFGKRGAPSLGVVLANYSPRLYRNEAHANTLDGMHLEQYEALFDEERERLKAAVLSWRPSPPVRKSYAELREDICAYNNKMNNGYARHPWVFEQQELRGKQEAFKARVRHDLLDNYDELARACKNLLVPETYRGLQKRARKAIAASYPELFNIQEFAKWRQAAPDPVFEEPEEIAAPGLAGVTLAELSWPAPSLAPRAPLALTENQVLQELSCAPAYAGLHSLAVAVLRRQAEVCPLPLRLAEAKQQTARILESLTASGKAECRLLRTSVWDDQPEPQWAVPVSGSLLRS